MVPQTLRSFTAQARPRKDASTTCAWGTVIFLLQGCNIAVYIEKTIAMAASLPAKSHTDYRGNVDSALTCPWRPRWVPAPHALSEWPGNKAKAAK